MNVILPVASGKGGVGKTVFATNLAVSLAKLGKTVVLVDLDLGASNVHTCLGIKNPHAGIGAMAFGAIRELESALLETDIPGLFFVPGDGLLPGTANLEFFVKNRILKQLSTLTCDIVVLDLGAGTANNVIDFFLASDSGFLVTTPEITAVLNAYSFLKSTVYRMLYRSFPAGSGQRERLKTFAARTTEGSGVSFLDMARAIDGEFPGSNAVAGIERLTPRMVINMAQAPSDRAFAERLHGIAAKNLGSSPLFAGLLPRDDSVARSVALRKPAAIAFPDSTFSRSMASLASTIASGERPRTLTLFEDDGDRL